MRFAPHKVRAKHTPRSGATLIELLVVLAILAVLYAATVTPGRSVKSLRSETADVTAAARDSALRLGVPVTVRVRRGSEVTLITLYPDGRCATYPHDSSKHSACR